MSDSIIYEAQPIPPEEPENRSRRQRTAILGAVGLVVLLLIGVAFGALIFSGSDEEPLADTSTTVTQPPTRDDLTPSTTPPSPTRSQAGTDDEAGAYSVAPRPPRGDPTPPLPQMDFDWERVVFELPGSEMTYIQQVAAIGDGFIVLGSSFEDDGATQKPVTWVSDDGVNWTRQDLSGDFTNANVWQLSFNEHGGVAIGDSWDTAPYGEELFDGGQGTSVVWTTVDGSTWQRTEFPRDSGSNEFQYLNTGVAGPSGFVVFGTVENAPNYPPIVIEKDGLSLELSNQGYTYRVLDGAGNVLASGSQEDFYRYNDEGEGQSIWDPVTNDLIVVVPYEIWEQAFAEAYERSGNGPFGQFVYTPVDVVVEHEGWRITVNQETTYSVENIASGEIVVSADADSLWQGPPPEITDTSGNVLMSFTWDEFYLAQETYWQGQGEPPDYSIDTVVYFSADGVNWHSTALGKGAIESNVESVAVVDDRFLAMGFSYDGSGEDRQVLVSTDGLEWTVAAELPDSQYLWNMTHGPDGRLLAFSDGPDGQGVWASDNGINAGANWFEVLAARVPEDENVYEWFNWLSSGDLGTMVVGSRETNTYETERPDPLTITQGEYTLTFDDYDWPPRVTVVDNQTGDTVIDVLLNSEEEGPTPLPEGFFYEDGVTIIENNDIVLLTISDEEFDAAQQARWSKQDEQYRPPVPTMYFSTNLEDWFEVPLAGVIDEGFVNNAAVGANAVLLSSEIFPEYHVLEGDFDEATSTVVSDFGPVNPEFVFYVGRPQ